MNLENLTSKEKGYIFGLFEGDGYSNYHKKSRHYVVEFYMNSENNKEIIRLLCRLLKKLKLNVFLMKDKRFNCIRVKVNSIEFYNFINQEYLSFLKKSEFSIGFISGFLDAEGYVNKKHSTLNIVNTDLDILTHIQDILNKNHIKNKLSLRKNSLKDKKKSYILHISVRFKSLAHISIKAGKL